MRNKILLPLFVILSLGIFLASCSGLRQMDLDKRHYRNGFYVHRSGNVNNEVSSTNTINPAADNISSAAVVPANTVTATPFAQQAGTPVSENKTASVQVLSSANDLHAENKTTTSNPVESSTQNSTMIIHHDHMPAGGGDTDIILLVILAILIPCVAVLLKEGGITTNFWIDLLLMLLFWIPGVVFALLVVFDVI
ncbi:MAG TPA: YqaE/Pmp3 family membrane protein [Bacteroidia bacterium]|jgi:uncharacterized membrane protein YqaE (UPF0057 family)|nr:YqaE/Pmp3 family membrane protein [Bacteroidia bacterium]